MYTYEKFYFRIFPVFLLILGTVFTFSKMYIEGSMAGGFGAIFSFSFKGFIIDPETCRIRKYDRFLWFYVGKWRDIPTPRYVTIVRIKLSSRRSTPLPLPSPGESNAVLTYKMNLVVEGKERYIPLTYGNRHTMLEEGLKLSKLLNIPCLDHTSCEKKWLS